MAGATKLAGRVSRAAVRESLHPVNETRLTGTYLLGLEPIYVFEHDGDLVMTFPGVPAPFAARVIPEGDHFRLEGGQLDGSELIFAEGYPSPGGTLGNVIEFRRASEPLDAFKAPGGRGLLPPPFNPSTAERHTYERLLHDVRTNLDGGLLEWNLAWPKWRFIEWLTQQEAVIFHGSPKSDIESFLPVRHSVEIMDQGGTGNLAAIYGTPFGLWAMWFAVIDRDRLKGSIQNGVMRWTDRQGQALDLYHFSVHHEYVGGGIWREGTLYLLPRESFRPIPFFPGGPDSNEWASPSELRPLKRITIRPQDFPFLHQVGGHDDSELLETEHIGEVVMSKVTRARRIAGGLEVALAWDDELSAVMDDYVKTGRKFTPDVEREVIVSGPGQATMRVTGPPGFLQSFETSLKRLGVVWDDRI